MSRSCRAPATCGPPRHPGSSVPAPAGAWELPEELVMLRDTVRRFMDAQVHPLEEKLDHDTVGLPREQLVELQAKARELGLWSLQTPEEYGGAGLSVLGQVVVAEEAAKCRMGAFFPALGAFGGNPPTPDDSLKSLSFAEYLVARKSFNNDSVANLARRIYSSRLALAAQMPGDVGQNARVDHCRHVRGKQHVVGKPIGVLSRWRGKAIAHDVVVQMNVRIDLVSRGGIELGQRL